MFTRLDYSSALEYSIIRRYTNSVYYYYYIIIERSPKKLGIIIDPSLSFHKHCKHLTDRIDKRNNMLNALDGSSWRQDKDPLLLTYNALGNLTQTMLRQSGAPIYPSIHQASHPSVHPCCCCCLPHLHACLDVSFHTLK